MVKQNIKNKNSNFIDSKLYSGNYYDFMLYKGESVNQSLEDVEGLAIADFSSLSISSGILYSSVVWNNAVNNGVEMEDIGFTAMDNGLISFKKDRITNEQFLNLYLNSVMKIDSGDTRLFLTPVTGNTLMYDYPMFLVENDGERYISCKGGFYQGFFKLDGFDYQVLPERLSNDIVMHFNVRPRSDYEVEEKNVNHTHPDNEGIFFFIGTRAENKFWPLYKTDSAITAEFRKIDATNDGYFSISGESYAAKQNNIIIPQDWLLKENNTESAISTTTNEQSDVVYNIVSLPMGTGYLNTYDYNPDNVCNCTMEEQSEPQEEDECLDCCSTYFKDSYFDNQCPEEDNGKAIVDEYQDLGVEIDFNGYKDSDGHEPNKRGYYEIETDNKFLLFNRTDTGFTTDNWVEGTKLRFEGRKKGDGTNYFLLFNRTDTGYTVDTIDQYNEEHETNYDIYKDIRNNVFCLRITPEGAIGYRYGVLNCDDESDKKYEVKEEYSKEGLVKTDEWNSINVRFVPIPQAENKCDNRQRLMKILIYVNGFLIFISKELPALLFKALDDVYQKQETVPYNISLGGGSLGLMETISLNYYKVTDYILPIERDFCGTFMGDIKSFKIYEGFINYSSIINYLS